MVVLTGNTKRSSWICKELEQYDASKLEVAMQALMKQLAATLSRQSGIQYEFGP